MIPDDLACLPVPADKIQTNNLLVRVRPNSQHEAGYETSFVGIVDRTYRFRALADFQVDCFSHTKNIFHDQLQRSDEILDEIKKQTDPNPGPCEAIASDVSEEMNCAFPAYSFVSGMGLKDYGYQNISTNLYVTDNTGKISLSHRFRSNQKYPAKSISFIFKAPRYPDINIPGHPTFHSIQEALDKHPEHFEPTEKEIIDKLRKLVVIPDSDTVLRPNTPRPIWLRRSLFCLFPANLEQMVRALLPVVGYSFSEGPWKDSVICYGYDPRTDMRARFLQVVRVPHRNPAAMRTVPTFPSEQENDLLQSTEQAPRTEATDAVQEDSSANQESNSEQPQVVEAEKEVDQEPVKKEPEEDQEDETMRETDPEETTEQEQEAAPESEQEGEKEKENEAPTESDDDVQMTEDTTEKDAEPAVTEAPTTEEQAPTQEPDAPMKDTNPPAPAEDPDNDVAGNQFGTPADLSRRLLYITDGSAHFYQLCEVEDYSVRQMVISTNANTLLPDDAAAPTLRRGSGWFRRHHVSEIRKAILRRIDQILPRQLAEEANVEPIVEENETEEEMPPHDLPLRPILWEKAPVPHTPIQRMSHTRQTASQSQNITLVANPDGEPQRNKKSQKQRDAAIVQELMEIMGEDDLDEYEAFGILGEDDGGSDTEEESDLEIDEDDDEETDASQYN